MMARVKLWAEGDPVDADLLAAVEARRGGNLLDLDRALIRSTPLAIGWNTLLGQVRSEFSLPHQYRELIMCRVAMLNGADFEWRAHQPIYLAAGGTEAKSDALLLPGIAALFDEKEAALIALTDQSTRAIKVDATVIDRLNAAFGEVQTIEAVAVVAAYNMVSRFLVALDI
jgi:alkylhydroperoxidase family enzyme